MTNVGTGEHDAIQPKVAQPEEVKNWFSVLVCYAKKWIVLVASAAALVAAGGFIRDCVTAGADVAGIQTEAKATEAQGVNKSEHESIRGEVKALDANVSVRIKESEGRLGKRLDQTDKVVLEMFKAVAPKGYERYELKRERGR